VEVGRQRILSTDGSPATVFHGPRSPAPADELVVGSLGSDDLQLRPEFGMASISERESREIEAANASGTTPVVFIHGLWLLPSSWANWADFFKQAGYAPLTPDWPDDPETVEQARANPDVLAKK
jgi:pimeloyl-ACP methyl ester carboxylesterase